MRHRCSVIGCTAAVPEVQALCRDHWNRVSPATRWTVLSAWRALKRRPGEPPRTPTVILATLTTYCDALSRAIAEAAGVSNPEKRP